MKKKEMPGLMPAGPPTHAAECSVRPIVVRRKISDGTRSPTGTATFIILATTCGAWRTRRLDPPSACRRLLLEPAQALPGRKVTAC
jgi:hypothetical protein